MPQNHTTELARLSIPLPLSLALAYLESGGNVTLTVTPAMLREAVGGDPRDNFTPLDRLIAEVVDDHGPIQAAGVVKVLDEEHDRLTSEGVVRDRFSNKNPLKQAGYRHIKGEGYVSPDYLAP